MTTSTPTDTTNDLRRMSLDLTTSYPRSPRRKLGRFVVAARTLDKCRAVLAGTAGDYHFDCPLDQLFFQFSGISAEDFKAAAATGKDDQQMAEWIEASAREISDEEVIQWNNDLRYKRISEMDTELQVFLEGYIDEYLPSDAIVYHWFDVYDIEEGRIE